MIDVTLEFAIYFYLVTTSVMAIALWYWWQGRNVARWEDFVDQGRKPLKNCEFCGARYVDSKGSLYSECPHCHQLNEVGPKRPIN